MNYIIVFKISIIQNFNCVI